MTARWSTATSEVICSLTVVDPVALGLTVVAGALALGLASRPVAGGLLMEAGAVALGLASRPVAAGLLMVAGALALGLASRPVAGGLLMVSSVEPAPTIAVLPVVSADVSSR
jgi:hypothetical protein